MEVRAAEANLVAKSVAAIEVGISLPDGSRGSGRFDPEETDGSIGAEKRATSVSGGFSMLLILAGASAVASASTSWLLVVSTARFRTTTQ